MASTLTIEARGRDRRAAVPVLLESFPTPPSFIPPSSMPMLSSPASPYPRSASPLSPAPSPLYKQPPSAPPSSPLPPVPGPSPITEHETLMFISAARNRRASKMSLASASSYSQRDSIVSASGSSAPSLSPSSSATPYDSSRSLASLSSVSSLSVPSHRLAERSPVIQPRINEEDAADLTRMSLDEISMHSPLPEHLSDDEKVLDIGISPPRPRHRYNPRDSISSVDMSELPPFRYDEPDILPSAPGIISRNSKHFLTSSRRMRGSISTDPVLPFSPMASSIPDSGSSRHPTDKALPPVPPAPAPPPPGPAETRSQTLSRSKSQPQAHTRRSSSPDIKDILANTPRPRRKSSHGSGLLSRSNSRSVRNLRRKPSDNLFSEVRSAPGSRRTSAADGAVHRTSAPFGQRGAVPSLRPDSTELAYAQIAMTDEVWDEDSFVSDYGVPLDATGTPYDVLDAEEEDRLERELDGGGSDSDSSLDLHTPLPQLMVKDGLLSPNSKLVQASRNTTPLPGDRPGSVFSVASTVGSMMTKTGLFKDERDTTRRRVRHRDGRLLRGGVGLTTGLGWSDSEDEDAPAPLVHQFSSHSLKLRAAASSGSLRSTSSSTMSYGEHMTDSRREEYEKLPKVPRASLPPTSWQRPRYAALDRTTSISSSRSSASSSSAPSRTLSRTSTSSYRSAPAGTSGTTKPRGMNIPSLRTKSLGHIREGDERGFNTPSTSSSTGSLITPITPADSPAQIQAKLGSFGAKKTPAKLDIPTASDLSPRDVVILNSPGSQSSSSLPSPALSNATPRVPRPLRLPQAQGSLRTPSSSSSSARPAATPISPSASAGPSSSTPSLRHKSSSQGLRPPQARGSQTPRPIPNTTAATSQPASKYAAPAAAAVAAAATTNASAASRLKPRTGTGMVYRTSPNTPTTPAPPAPGVRPSMLRMPSSTSLRTAKGVGVV